MDVDLVEIHTTVVDAKDRPLGGLAKDNFRILENGVEQPIAVFKHEDIPVSLGLVIDNSRSIEPRKDRVDVAALSFVRKSNPEDEAFVVHFDFEARVSEDFTEDIRKLESVLAWTRPYGQTAMYDAVNLALDNMSKATRPKKALLLVTDGEDNMSKISLTALLERVKREKVAIFAIGLLSESGGMPPERALIQIAEASGGRAYFPETIEQAREIMERIARDLREQYTIGYFPTNPVRDGAWRAVRVEITPPKDFPPILDVKYRHGYYAPSPTTRADGPR
jgi:VWFA-related protein